MELRFLFVRHSANNTQIYFLIDGSDFSRDGAGKPSLTHVHIIVN